MSGISGRGRRGSVVVPNWRWEDPSLDSYDLHVAGWLASHTDGYLADHVTRNAIAKATGISGERVSKSIQKLASSGVIEVDDVALPQSKGGHRWVITFDWEVWESPPDPGRVAPSNPGRVTTTPGRVATSTKDAQLEEQQEEPSGSTSSPAPHGFDEFWETYPRKVGKPAALRAFKAAAKGPRERTEAILDGLVTWCQAWKRAGTAAAFIPHPATWLNQHRWNDTPDLDTTPATSGLASAVIEAAEPFFVEHHGDWFRHVQQPTFSAMIELMKRWGFDYPETMIRVAIQLRRNPAKALDPVTLRNINEVERFEGFPTTYDLPESMRRAASLGHWKAAW